MEEKKTIVVNLYAGPGAGKSTFAAYIFSKLKINGYSAELVTEFAKDLVWEERFKTLNDEVYLFGKQQHRFYRLKGKVDVIVTDSPLLLKLMYMGEAPESLKDLVLDIYYNEYDNIDVFVERYKKFDPRGRVQTEEEARQKDDEIKEILGHHSNCLCTMVGNTYGADAFIRKLKTMIDEKLKGEE